MLAIEPPAGRRTARAAFDFDVLVGPALPEDDLLAPAFAAVGVTVGAAYEANKISVMKTTGRNQRNGNDVKPTDDEFDGEAMALLPMVEVVAQFDVAGAG